MYQENEVIALILSLGVLIFIIIQRQRIRRIPRAAALLAAFAVFLAGSFLTVLEGFFLGAALNVIEHVCYAAGSILLAMYALRIFAGKTP